VARGAYSPTLATCFYVSRFLLYLQSRKNPPRTGPGKTSTAPLVKATAGKLCTAVPTHTPGCPVTGVRGTLTVPPGQLNTARYVVSTPIVDGSGRLTPGHKDLRSAKLVCSEPQYSAGARHRRDARRERNRAGCAASLEEVLPQAHIFAVQPATC